MSDLALAGRYFDDSARAYSRFARSSLCRCARRPGFERIVRRLDGLDHILFRVAPAHDALEAGTLAQRHGGERAKREEARAGPASK